MEKWLQQLKLSIFTGLTTELAGNVFATFLLKDFESESIDHKNLITFRPAIASMRCDFS